MIWWTHLIVILVALFVYIVPATVIIHDNLSEPKNPLLIAKANIQILLQKQTFYTWFIVTVIHILVSLFTLYSVIACLMCDLGYGSRGINKVIMKV